MISRGSGIKPYFNLSFRDVTLPDWKDDLCLFRPMEYRTESWWARFCKTDGSGLVALDLTDVRPRNHSFVREEIATVIGTPSVGSTYGSYIVDSPLAYLRAFVVVAQDPPSSVVSFDVLRDSTVVAAVKFVFSGQQTQEFVSNLCVVPLLFVFGDIVSLRLVSSGVVSLGGNYKIYGVLSQ